MTDRLLTLTVTGFTPAGYEISFQALDVKPGDVAASIAWFDNTLAGHGVRSVAGRDTQTGKPVMNENGTHKCALHGVDMEAHTKGSSTWYSHKVTGADGTEKWCRGK